MSQTDVNTARIDWILDFLKQGNYWVGTTKGLFDRITEDNPLLFSSPQQLGRFLISQCDFFAQAGISCFNFKQHTPQARCIVLSRLRDPRALRDYDERRKLRGRPTLFDKEFEHEER